MLLETISTLESLYLNWIVSLNCAFIELHRRQKKMKFLEKTKTFWRKYQVYFVDVWQYLVIIIIFLIGLIFIL